MTMFKAWNNVSVRCKRLGRIHWSRFWEWYGNKLGKWFYCNTYVLLEKCRCFKVLFSVRSSIFVFLLTNFLILWLIFIIWSPSVRIGMICKHWFCLNNIRFYNEWCIDYTFSCAINDTFSTIHQDKHGQWLWFWQ